MDPVCGFQGKTIKPEIEGRGMSGLETSGSHLYFSQMMWFYWFLQAMIIMCVGKMLMLLIEKQLEGNSAHSKSKDQVLHQRKVGMSLLWMAQ